MDLRYMIDGITDQEITNTIQSFLKIKVLILINYIILR